MCNVWSSLLAQVLDHTIHDEFIEVDLSYFHNSPLYSPEKPLLWIRDLTEENATWHRGHNEDEELGKSPPPRFHIRRTSVAPKAQFHLIPSFFLPSLYHMAFSAEKFPDPHQWLFLHIMCCYRKGGNRRDPQTPSMCTWGSDCMCSRQKEIQWIMWTDADFSESWSI